MVQQCACLDEARCATDQKNIVVNGALQKKDQLDKHMKDVKPQTFH